MAGATGDKFEFQRVQGVKTGEGLVRKRKGVGRPRSDLRLRCVSPLWMRAGSFLWRARPFDVIAICWRPRGRSWERRAGGRVSEEGAEQEWKEEDLPTMSMMSLRTVGSPPVNLIFLTPACTNNVASRMISSVVRRLEFGESSMPSSGIQ
jgi:hypothetical protein